MGASGEVVSFAAVARKASVSTDFLYRHPTLRARIADLRRATSASSPPPAALETTSGTSCAVRALAAEVKQARARHREEVAALQKALAAAHGENLQLRRRLRRDRATDDGSSGSPPDEGLVR